MAEDWTRFDYYASRIRTFIPDLFDSHGLPHHALDVLDTLSSVRGGPIVPNLQSVIFLWSSASVALRCIRAIAPATLREVRLSPDASISGPNVPLSLPEFALSYPSVQKAAFHVYNRCVGFSAIGDALARWHELCSLDLLISPTSPWMNPEPRIGITSKELCKLSSTSLPNLHKLALRVQSRMTYARDDADLSQRSKISFHSLRDFIIQLGTTACVTALLTLNLQPFVSSRSRR